MPVTVNEAGKRGGFARAKNQSPSRLSEIGQQAARQRWSLQGRTEEIREANKKALAKLIQRDEGKK